MSEPNPTTTQADHTLELTAKLFDKLRRVMGAVGSLKREGYNDFHKYAYVRDQDVKEAVRQAMFDNSLMWFPSCTRVEQEGNHTASTFVVTLVDTETGFTWEFPWFGEANDTQDKGFSKSTTLGFKYLWLTMLLVGVDDDPDGSSTERKAGQRRQVGGQTFEGKVLESPGDYAPTFTRYAGRKLRDIAQENKGFAKWVIDSIAPDSQDRADLIANCKAFVGMAEPPRPVGKDPTELVTSPGHWLNDEETRRKFWVYVEQELGLSNEQAHEALGVESVYEYTGSKTDALNSLQAYAKAVA